jgi:GNAT superfamily N-acetyltransferase
MLGQRQGVGFDVVLLVAVDARERVRGFALIHCYEPIATAYLDYIAIDQAVKSRGLGSALYEAVREHMLRKGARALLLDVPPDQPELVSDPARLAPNRARLRSYERHGARPIDRTSYQVKWDATADSDPPLLVLDPLGGKSTLSRVDARRAVRAIFSSSRS